MLQYKVRTASAVAGYELPPLLMPSGHGNGSALMDVGALTGLVFVPSSECGSYSDSFSSVVVYNEFRDYTCSLLTTPLSIYL